jgi:hypothetical protein
VAPNFLSVRWCREALHGLGFQDVESLIPVCALFLLDGGSAGKKKKRRKKITVGKEGFCGAGPALLILQWVAAVR